MRRMLCLSLGLVVLGLVLSGPVLSRGGGGDDTFDRDSGRERSFVLKRRGENKDSTTRSRVGTRRGSKGISSEDESAFLEELKETDEEKYNRLLDLKENNSRMYQRLVRMGIRKQKNLNRLKEKNPEAYKRVMEKSQIRKDLKSLRKDYRTTDSDKEKGEIETEIQNKLNHLFELRMQEKESQIKKMRERAKKMENSFTEQKKNRDKIVRQKIEEITGQNQKFDW